MNKINTVCIAFIFGILLNFLSAEVSGQFYSNGQDPFSLHWKQINTSHYKLIFPNGFQSEAQRLANILDYSYAYTDYSIKSQPRKIPVIIHNQTTFSNGMVVWAPKRVEFYTVPDPNSYPQDELEQLSLHELRHVAQLSKIDHGFTGTLGYVTGELAVGGLSALMPLWFLEGDAVTTETLLSHSGRGRLPSFEMGLRAISLERGRLYHYDKSLLGSYKDYVPGRYKYGYQVTAWSRARYGMSFWNHALDEIAGYPFLVNPVNVSFWKQDRMTKRRLYDSAFVSLHRKWAKEDMEISPTSFIRISPTGHKAYTSYRFPRFLNDSLLVAERSGIDDINRFVLIDQDGQEKVLFTPGYYQSVRLSAGGGKVVWAETVYDERWENRNFSVIKMLDTKTGNVWTMTHRSRYFAPDISADGTKIAAVRIETDNTCYLDILDASHGNVLQRFHLPGNNSMFKPVWSGQHEVLVIILTDKGKEIRALDTSNGEWTSLYMSGFTDIQSMWPAGQYILFHSTLSGIDNIYALDRKKHTLYQVTSSRFGASDVCVSPKGNKIVYANYSSHGYTIVEIPFNPTKWKPVDPAIYSDPSRIQTLLKQERGVVNTTDIPDTTFNVKTYSKPLHLFRFHSWLPLYVDYENFTFDQLPVSPGLMLFSQNLLSTASGSVAYAYKDHQHQFISRFTFSGLYPVFDLSYRLGGEPVISRDSSGIPLPATIPVRNDFRLHTYVPLNLTNNRFSKGLVPSLDLNYTNSLIWDGDIQAYEKGRMLITYRMYYYALLKSGIRDILPRLGFSLDARFTHAPWDAPRYGTLGTVLGTVYLPGVLRHHTLRIRAGLEKQQTSKFLYLNRLSYPRGYNYWLSEKLITLQSEYDFPLLYPDLALSSLLYISRLRGKLFWEMAEGEGNYEYQEHQYIPDKKQFLSVGAELDMDCFPLRIGFPVTVGAWGAYLPSEGQFQKGLTFNIDVYGLSINKRKNQPIRPSPAGLY